MFVQGNYTEVHVTTHTPVTILGILSTFFAGVVSLYVQSRLGQIKRVDVPNLADDVDTAVDRGAHR